MKKTEKIAAAVLTMLIGVFLIVMKDNFIGILMTVAGVSLVVFGVVDICNRAVPPAVVKIVSGILITVCGWLLVEAVLFIASALLLMCGILLLYDKIKKRYRCETFLKTAIDYAIPIGLILIGFVFLFQKTATVNFIFIVCGCLTLIEGGILLVNAFDEE